MTARLHSSWRSFESDRSSGPVELFLYVTGEDADLQALLRGGFLRGARLRFARACAPGWYVEEASVHDEFTARRTDGRLKAIVYHATVFDMRLSRYVELDGWELVPPASGVEVNMGTPPDVEAGGGEDWLPHRFCPRRKETEGGRRGRPGQERRLASSSGHGKGGGRP